MKQLLSAVVAIASLACAQNARAGVSPPVISGGYYEQSGSQSCGRFSSSGTSGQSSGATSVTLCQLLFPAPPAGQQMALDSVACQLRLYAADGAALRDAYLAQNVGGSISRKRFLATTLQLSQDAEGYAIHTVDDVLNGSYLVVAPVRVVMDVTANSVLSVECQITGTLRSTPAP